MRVKIDQAEPLEPQIAGLIDAVDQSIQIGTNEIFSLTLQAMHPPRFYF